MFYQVQNSKLKRNNQFRVQTIPHITNAAKSRNWNIADCKFEQIRDELVTNKYKELDGRMNVRGKQFAMRAGL